MNRGYLHRIHQWHSCITVASKTRPVFRCLNSVSVPRHVKALFKRFCHELPEVVSLTRNEFSAPHNRLNRTSKTCANISGFDFRSCLMNCRLRALHRQAGGVTVQLSQTVKSQMSRAVLWCHGAMPVCQSIPPRHS